MKALIFTDPHRGHDHKTHIVHHRFFLKIKKIIEKQYVDIVIISGDICSNKTEQYESFFRAIREILPEIPILIVHGNHDYWDLGWYTKKKRHPKNGIKEKDSIYQDVCRKYNIHYLQYNPFVWNNEIVICGFDGWYAHNTDATNDKAVMAKSVESSPTFNFMSWRAYDALDFSLKYVEGLTNEMKKVCVSHFSLNPKNANDELFSGNPSYFNFIIENFDVFIYGHTHNFEDQVYGKCRVVNAGTAKDAHNVHGYNRPQAYVIDIKPRGDDDDVVVALS